MKLGSRLKVISILHMLFALVLATVLVWIFERVGTEGQKSCSASQLVKSVFEINLIANDYILYHEPRAVEQWRSKQESLSAEILASEALFTRPKHLEILREIRGDYERIKGSFAELVAQRGRNLPASAGAAVPEFEKTLIVHLLADSHRIVSNASLLEKAGFSDLAEDQKKAAWVMVSLTVLLMIFIFLATAVFRRKMVDPIVRLQQGAGIIGSGNLDYQVGSAEQDEIGQLSRAFDAMTLHLKASRTEIEVYRRLVEMTGDGVLRFRPADGRILFLNRGLLRLFDLGGEPRQLTGKMLPEVLGHDGCRGFIEALCRDPRDLRNVECLYKTFSGEDRWLLLNAFLFEESSKGPKVLEAVVKDISERKRIENFKDEVIRNVSHELRTPLHAVREGINVILDGLVGTVEEGHRDILTTVKGNLDRLVRLINNFLDFQSLDAGVLKLKPVKVRLSDLLEEIRSTLGPLARNKNLDLRFECEDARMEAEADRDRLVQVILNLAGNAIKFTERGKVAVEVRQKDGEVEISVADTGIGIEASDIPKLFTRFGQLEAGKFHASTGTGLGLAISKKIIEQHGGKIWVDPGYRAGSRFVFTLPLNA